MTRRARPHPAMLMMLCAVFAVPCLALGQNALGQSVPGAPRSLAPDPALPPSAAIESQPLAPPAALPADPLGEPPAAANGGIEGGTAPGGEAAAGTAALAPSAVPNPASPEAGAASPPVLFSPDWQKRQVAELQALDKVEARAEQLEVPVGQSGQFGALAITVRACLVRPPDQASDAAALLQISDPHPGAPGFSGWMLAAEPSLGMLEHPIYDVRVLGCR